MSRTLSTSRSKYAHIFLFAALLAVITLACRTVSELVAAPTSTPAPFSVEDIESAPCWLLDDLEVQGALEVEVAGQMVFSDGSVGCVYRTLTDKRGAFQMYVTTDETLRRRKANLPYQSAVEQYQSLKLGNLNMQTKLPNVFKVEDIDNLGDQAFLTESTFLSLHVIKNKIYYQFVMRTGDESGYDVVMQLAKTALQRAP